jgi:acetate CoA/acetoacetate CoA-transferase alpha subunit
MAAKTTIVEADEIVAAGEINPEDVMLPGIFVKHIVPSKGYNWKWSWQTQG